MAIYSNICVALSYWAVDTAQPSDSKVRREFRSREPLSSVSFALAFRARVGMYAYLLSRTNTRPISHLYIWQCRNLKKSVVGLVARVFEFPVLGGVLKLLHLMLITLGIALVSSVRTITRLQEQQLAVELSSNSHANPMMYDALRLNKRWRAERNLWLSAFAFTMWTVLAIFYREMARRLRIEDRLAEFETSDCTGTIDSTIRDVSVSKEVTSRPHMLTPRNHGIGREGGGRGSPFSGFGGIGGDGGSPSGVREAMKSLATTVTNDSGGSRGHGEEKKDK